MLKMKTMLLLLLPLSAACRVKQEAPAGQRSVGEAQMVALVVRSEPSGALVRVNRLPRTWTTPCDVADFSLQKGPVEVELSLEGYDTYRIRVNYDGVDPARVEARLVKRNAPAAAPRAPVAVPVPVPAPAPTLIPVPPPAPAPTQPPLKTIPSEGGTRIKITSPTTRIRVQAARVVTDIDRPGEIFLPDVPPQKATIEFLDPKADTVLHSVEILSGGTILPVTPAPASVDEHRVGEVRVASQKYGVFVKLEPGQTLQPGEEILIYREGREVARTKILKVVAGDAAYPDGAVQIPKDGDIQKGDEARRLKP